MQKYIMWGKYLVQMRTALHQHANTIAEGWLREGLKEHPLEKKKSIHWAVMAFSVLCPQLLEHATW